MEYVVADEVLEDLLVKAAWEAGMRNKVNVLRQVKNGIREGSLEWIRRKGLEDANTSNRLSLSAIVKSNEGGV
jgi:hypothetical protein